MNLSSCHSAIRDNSLDGDALSCVESVEELEMVKKKIEKNPI